MTRKNEKMTFKGYYEKLGSQNPQAELRDEICKKLEIAEVTFYHKLRNQTFTPLEKKEISKLTKRNMNDLFPIS